MDLLQEVDRLLSKNWGAAHPPLKQLGSLINDMHSASRTLAQQHPDELARICSRILDFVLAYPGDAMQEFRMRDMTERAFVMWMMLVMTNTDAFGQRYRAWALARYAMWKRNAPLFRNALAGRCEGLHDESDAGVQALRRMQALYLPHAFASATERTEKVRCAEEALQWLVDHATEWANHPLFPKPNVSIFFTCNPLFIMTYMDKNVCGAMKHIATLYSALLQQSYTHMAPNAHLRGTRNGRKRIGFLSRCVGSHSIGRISYGLVEELARTQKYDLYLYTDGDQDSLIGKRLAAVTRVHTLKVAVPENVDKIRSHRLDALVILDPMQDLLLYLLASHRMAPVQISTWGHPGTSGLDTIDYYVTSKYFQEQQSHYCETLVQFDSLSLCYRHVNELIRPCATPTFDLVPYLRHEIGVPKARRIIGMPLSVRIYGLVGPSFKITPEFDEVIYQILCRDPQGVVTMVQSNADEKATLDCTMERLKTRLGPLMARFLVLRGPLLLLHFHAYIFGCNVILDTFPFGGFISTYDTLSVGRCMVAKPCERLGRFTAGLYAKMGVDGLIARNTDEYVDIALRVANDTAWMAEKESAIRANLHKIHDDQASVDEWVQFLDKVTTANIGS